MSADSALRNHQISPTVDQICIEFNRFNLQVAYRYKIFKYQGSSDRYDILWTAAKHVMYLMFGYLVESKTKRRINVSTSLLVKHVSGRPSGYSW